MPRMMKDDAMENGKINGLQGFHFSATRINNLSNLATEFTLVTVAVDLSGSVSGFSSTLRKCLISAVDSCKRSPRANNLLLRVMTFNSLTTTSLDEIHGFKPLSEIDTSLYPTFKPGGLTPLYDAIFSSVGATNAYAKKLMDQEFTTNGIVFVITDGCDNASQATISMIKNEIDRAKIGEEIESLISVLIGINDNSFSSMLQDLATGVGMNYINAGEASENKLAKLASFISQSVSSQSQALGTGGPSQNISANIN